MPRTAKPQRQTMTGDKALPIEAVAHQEYGKGVQQMDMQRALPAPNMSPMPTPPASPALVAPTPTQVQAESVSAAPPSPPSAVEAAAAMQGGPGLFHLPRTSPHPLTAGLPSGPGPGPEMLGPTAVSPLAQTMALLSQQTGDPFFINLARQNGLAT